MKHCLETSLMRTVGYLKKRVHWHQILAGNSQEGQIKRNSFELRIMIII